MIFNSSKSCIAQWRDRIKVSLRSEISPEQYALNLRGSRLIAAGSFIAIFETFFSLYLGIRQAPYIQFLMISLFVITATSVLLSVTYFNKKIILWKQWLLFGVYLIFFLFCFCFWIYRLEELRILAIIAAFTIITILLYYTDFFQSLLISVLILISYYSVSWYSIKIAGQAGSLLKESFFSLCLLPSFLIISSAAYYINKKRSDLQNAKSELMKLNSDLSYANEEFRKEQTMTEIEMDIAGEIQRAILPGKVPSVSGWDIALMTKPYGAVSGDFYDFYCRDNNLKGISLFDVSGHGVAPALITILAKPVIYNYFSRCEYSVLGSVLDSANTDLIDQLEEVNLYITGMILRMDGDQVEYSNAGHPDLLHYKSSLKKVEKVIDPDSATKGHPIGIFFPVAEYSSISFPVESGDFLVLYSDGLTEYRNLTGEQFGIIRLTDAISSSMSVDAAGIMKNITDSLNGFSGDTKPGDDITIIVALKK